MQDSPPNATAFCSAFLLPEFLPFSPSPSPGKRRLSTSIELNFLRVRRQCFGVIRQAHAALRPDGDRARACCPPILATDFLNGQPDSGLRSFLCSRLFEG